MTLTPIRNPGASIRQRLLDHAKANRDDYQRVLTRYAIERLLFRLSRTDARDDYILKGAMLFATWPQHVFRPTGDLDLLGHGDPDPAVIGGLLARICQIELPQDGIVFDPAHVQAAPVREEDDYRGIELSLQARLDTARISVRVDIGFGDRVYPEPKRATFPCMLSGLPPAELLMYPVETVVAEKFEAMIRFAEQNSRLKDFYDVWVVARFYRFDLASLVEAVKGTFRRRRTALPTEMPVALTPQFAMMDGKPALWTGFLRRNPPALEPPSFQDLLAELRRFFDPVLSALALPDSANGRWNPARGSWEPL